MIVDVAPPHDYYIKLILTGCGEPGIKDKRKVVS